MYGWMARNPWKTNFAVFLLLCCFVIGLLAFAHAFAPKDQRVCFVFPVWWRWVAWIGCIMAAHENLAAGLIGGGGALFAAWVAANSIVQQMRLPLLAREEDRIEREGPGARDSIALIWAIYDELRKANGKPGPMLKVVATFARGTLIETNRFIAEKLPLVADDFRRPIAVTLYDLSEAVKDGTPKLQRRSRTKIRSSAG